VVTICTGHSTCLHLDHILYFALCNPQHKACCFPKQNEFSCVCNDLSQTLTPVKTTLHCQYWLATSWAQSLVLVKFPIFIVFFWELTICLVMGIPECDCYVGHMNDGDFILTYVGWNKFHVGLCDCFNIGLLLLIITQCVFVFTQGVYPFSALWMESAIYCNTSVLTYQTTRCYNAQVQNMNINSSQNPQC